MHVLSKESQIRLLGQSQYPLFYSTIFKVANEIQLKQSFEVFP